MARAFLLLVTLAAFATIGCGGPSSNRARSPSLAGGPSAPYDAEDRDRQRAAEQTAARDFECKEAVRAVAELPRKYSNEASLRYVIEGCGKRGTYLEDCTSFTCRYLLVAVVPTELVKPLPPPSTP